MIAMVINTIRLRHDNILRMYHEWILEFGLRILDLRYSACRELLCRTVYFIDR
jgi:hypothetical protein